MAKREYNSDLFDDAISLEELEDRLEMAGVAGGTCSVPIPVI